MLKPCKEISEKMCVINEFRFNITEILMKSHEDLLCSSERFNMMFNKINQVCKVIAYMRSREVMWYLKWFSEMRSLYGQWIGNESIQFLSIKSQEPCTFPLFSFFDLISHNWLEQLIVFVVQSNLSQVQYKLAESNSPRLELWNLIGILFLWNPRYIYKHRWVESARKEFCQYYIPICLKHAFNHNFILLWIDYPVNGTNILSV